MNHRTSKELDVTKIDGTDREEYEETKATYLITELRYRKDGVRNTRTMEVFPRGYELHVDIRDRSYGAEFMSESFVMCGDSISLRRHIEPAKMFSQKRFEALAVDSTVLAVATGMRKLALEQWTAKQAQDTKDVAESAVLAEV